MAINRDVAEIVDEIGRTDEISHNKSSKIISMVKTAVKTTETEFWSRQNKTKQTPLFPVTFQKPFSTFEEHFETIIMQIKELWWFMTTKIGTIVIDLDFIHIFINFSLRTKDYVTAHIDSHATSIQ